MKNIFKMILFLILFIGCCFGVSDVLELIYIPTEYSIFLALLIVLGGIFLVIHISEEENKKKKEELIEIAKKIYSLDYTNLKNIENIELQTDKKLIINLKTPIKCHTTINEIPSSQEQLEELDKKFNGIKNVKSGEKI